MSWIKEVPNPKIIDIGCGPGQFANMLFDKGVTDYKGIDFSREAIAMAKERNKLFAHAFNKDNALTSKIFSNDYNMVVLLEVLEHIENDLPILDKIKKDSTIIFSVPNFNSESHVRWFDTKDSIIRRYGNIVEVEDIQEVLYSYTTNKIYIVKGNKR